MRTARRRRNTQQHRFRKIRLNARRKLKQLYLELEEDQRHQDWCDGYPEVDDGR